MHSIATLLPAITQQSEFRLFIPIFSVLQILQMASNLFIIMAQALIIQPWDSIHYITIVATFRITIQLLVMEHCTILRTRNTTRQSATMLLSSMIWVPTIHSSAQTMMLRALDFIIALHWEKP